MKKIMIIISILLLALLISCGKTENTVYDHPLFDDGLINVQNEDRLWGYVDSDFNEVFAPQFNHSAKFTEEGYAIVSKNGFHVVIDDTGNFVYDLTEPYDYRSVYGGYALYQDITNNYYGIKDIEGNLLFETRDYYDLEFYNNPDFIVFLQNEKRGVMDHLGNILVEPTYDSISPIGWPDIDSIEYYIFENDGLFTIWNDDFEMISDHQFNSYLIQMDPDYLAVKEGRLWKLLNLQEKVLNDFTSDEVLFFNEFGISPFVDDDNYLGYMDIEGTVIMQTNMLLSSCDMFEYLATFKDGMMRAIDYEESVDYIFNIIGEVLYRSESGHRIWDYNEFIIIDYDKGNSRRRVLDYDGNVIYPYTEGQVNLIFQNKESFMVTFDDKTEIYNNDGNTLFSNISRDYDVSFSNGMYFFNDYDSKILRFCSDEDECNIVEGYTRSFSLIYYTDGYFIVEKDNRLGIANANGEIVLDTIYKIIISKDKYYTA